jgi:hypothetical protein
VEGLVLEEETMIELEVGGNIIGRTDCRRWERRKRRKAGRRKKVGESCNIPIMHRGS